MMIKLYWGTF